MHKTLLNWIIVLHSICLFFQMKKYCQGYTYLRKACPDVLLKYKVLQKLNLFYNFPYEILLLIQYQVGKYLVESLPKRLSKTFNIEFIRWFHEFSVTTNLRFFQETKFVYLFLCNVDVNNKYVSKLISTFHNIFLFSVILQYYGLEWILICN